jgi:RNA 2',3'-cyclic 3'-phosphodiesterase
MRANWFFGFPLDGNFVMKLPDPPPNIRRYHPADIHLTLVFLGGCGENAARQALGALDRALSDEPRAPIPISLGDVVPMGSRRDYSALSALLERGREETTLVMAQLRDILSRAALGHDQKRPPKPHVTLARTRRRATDEQRAAAIVWAEELDLRGVTATLDRVALYTWHEHRSQQLFKVVAERALSPKT